MPNPNEPIIKPRSGLTARLVTETRQNTAKFFTETRQLSWVLMVVTLLWGAYAYYAMPKRKDPELKVRKALAVCAWPGASAEEVEQQVTRKIEEKMAQNSRVETIESISRSNVSVVYLAVDEQVVGIGDKTVLTSTLEFNKERLLATGFQVDMRQPVVIRDTGEITRTLQTVPMVSKVTRSGARTRNLTVGQAIYSRPNNLVI